MRAVFSSILDMSLAGGIVILAVIAVRQCLRRAPRRWSMLLWSAAAFRLCCPVSIRSSLSIFSLLPQGVFSAPGLVSLYGADGLGVLCGVARASGPAGASELLPSIPQATAYVFPTHLPSAGAAQGAASVPAASSCVSASAGGVISPLSVLTAIWAAGMAAVLIHGAVRYFTLRRRLRFAVRLEDRVFGSEGVPSPFVHGLFKPVVFVPLGLDEATYSCVLAHERCHIRRGDQFTKLFAFILLALHWFNPLCWIAFRLMDKDMEMSCDEKVLAQGGDIRKTYSHALLSVASGARSHAAGAVAFGKNAVRSRIKHAMNYKKPKALVSAAAALLCIVMIAACATDPILPSSEADASAAEGTAPAAEATTAPAAEKTEGAHQRPAAAYTADPNCTNWYIALSITGSYSAYNTEAEWLLSNGSLRDRTEDRFRSGPMFVAFSGGSLTAFESKSSNYLAAAEGYGPSIQSGGTARYTYSGPVASIPREAGEQAARRLSEYAKAAFGAELSAEEAAQTGYIFNDYAVLVYACERGEVCCIYRTDDGENWYEFGSFPYTLPISGVCILSSDTGYICCCRHGLAAVYKTVDGGADWNEIDLTLPEGSDFVVWSAGSPVFSGDHGVMIVCCSDRSDESSGCFNAWFETSDGGDTWEFRMPDTAGD